MLGSLLSQPLAGYRIDRLMHHSDLIKGHRQTGSKALADLL